MKWQEFIAEIYLRLSRDMEEVVDGLTLDDLHRRSAPDANPIGWFCCPATPVNHAFKLL